MPVYSCQDMPTISAFMNDDAFIRGIMGPVGCLPPETEFMSLNGWKRMDAYEPGDSVLQWERCGSATWCAPSRYIVADAGPMLSFESGSLKMVLSLDHRVPHWNYRGEFRVSSAAEIASSTTRKTIPTTFDVAALGIQISDAEIRYRIMMQADGHFPRDGQQAFVTVRKERKKIRVRETLSAMDIRYAERVSEDRPTETRFVFYPPDRVKHFPTNWYGMSRWQFTVALDEAEHWDGLNEHAESRFYSTHKPDVDFIQFASHATGRRAVIRRKDYEAEKWLPGYVVYLRTGDNSKNRAQIRENTSIRGIESSDGKQYCFEVPTGFFVARHQDTVFVTGNSGKSSACVMELVQRGLAQAKGPDGVRRSRWAIIRNTNKELEDTTERTCLQWLSPAHFGIWTPSKHNYMINALRAPGDDKNAEIEFLFRALDRPDQIGDLLSLELTGAWVNEAREIPWAIVDALRPRCGRYPAMRDGGATWSGIVMDTNPPDADSEWFRFFEETDHTEAVAELAKIPGFEHMTVDKFRKLYKQPSGLAPNAENLKNLRPGYYQAESIGKSSEWIKVYVKGEYGFVMDGKAVWPEYNDAMHCPADEKAWPKPIQGVPILRGWDSSGLTPACVFTQITPRGQWIIFDEVVSTRMGASAIAEAVNDHSVRYYPKFDFEDVGDPAGMSVNPSDMRTYFEVLRAANIAIEPAIQTLEIRLESVRKPLRSLVEGRPQFLLHPRCKQLRRAMLGGYHLRRLRLTGERFTNTPDKNQYCVPMESEALTPTGWKLPEQLREGETIYGYDLETQRITKTTVEKLNVFQGESQIISWRNSTTSFRSTPAHNNVAKHRTGRIGLVQTADLNSAYYLMCAASEDRARKDRPFSDEFISLAAWVAAEGSFRQNDDAILLGQSIHHNPAYCEYLEGLLTKFPGTISHDTDGWSNPGMRSWRITKETAWLLRYWMPDKCPSPAFIAKMCNGNRRRFLYEFLRGDGHAGGVLPDPGDLGRARDFAPHSVSPRIGQKRSDVMDALQMMATLSGIRTQVRPTMSNGFPGFSMTVFTREPLFGIARRERHTETTNGVWCPTTGTGTWICRQKGQTFVTGNSHVADALGYAGTRVFGFGILGKGTAGAQRQREYEEAGPNRNRTTGY